MNTFVPTYPLFPTLANAITKTRRLTGSTNSFQVTDSYSVTQMHSFDSYDLPAKFRSLKLKDVYTFTTNVGQDVYPFNSELYITVNQPYPLFPTLANAITKTRRLTGSTNSFQVTDFLS